ncbi:MAG: hypothetical protein GQE15_10445 [Archangiaceae bacterium]|nr:hypothetical protein [Archangiaceae bacterium]
MRCSLLLLLAAACTTPKPTPDPVVEKPQPITAKANAVRARAMPFDVSVCAKPVTVRPLTRETLSAALVLEQPRFAECLASPTSREKDDASAEVEVSVAAAVTAKVTPRNVGPEGVSCLEQRVQQLALTHPATLTSTLTVAPAAGAPSTAAQLLPEVNAVRAAVASACNCFEPLGLNAPPQLVLKLGPASAPDVVTASDPLADKVERCLEQALAEFPRPSLELTVDLPLLNSDANQESPDASDEVVTTQREAMKRRAAAKLNLLLVQRTALVKQLEPIAQSYKRKPTPSLMKQRIALCGDLRAVEDALPAAVERAAPSKPVDTEPSQLCASVKREE